MSETYNCQTIVVFMTYVQKQCNIIAERKSVQMAKLHPSDPGVVLTSER